MIDPKHSFCSAPPLLIAALMVTVVSAGTPLSAHAAEISKTDQKKIEVRKDEENRLKKLDSSYKRQVNGLATQYEQSAAIVARQGGNPKPLLDAAAYFKNQAR